MRVFGFVSALLLGMVLFGCGQSVVPPSPPPVDLALLQQSLKNLESDKPSEQLQAAKALAQRGTTLREAVPALRRVLQESPNREVKLAVIEALGKMAPRALESLPDLQNAMESEDKEVREAALRAMVEIDS